MTKPPKNPVIGFRADEPTRGKLADLCTKWGGLRPMQRNDVIRLAVERAWDREFGGKGKKAKS